MAVATGFPEVFARLRGIIRPYAPDMLVTADSDTAYSLDTCHAMANGQPLFFSSVTIRKKYVSFHLMPVYAFPDLLDHAGEVRQRMQGKSCFNFRQLDDAQVAALTALVHRGYERYAEEGLLGER